MNFKQPILAENINNNGIRISVILNIECREGTLTILEQEVSIGVGSPAYICNREDKVILVTCGKFMFFADGKKYEAEKGANIFIPRGTLHNFKNIGTQTGVLLVTLTSGANANFLKPQSQTVKVVRKNRAVMHNVAKKYDVVIA